VPKQRAGTGTRTLPERPKFLYSWIEVEGTLAIIELPEELLELLRQPSVCYLATTMADGSPQLTQTWVDTDGEHILINSVQGFVKIKNIARDPRVAVAIFSPENTRRYFQVRGRVVNVTQEGAAEHIEKLAHKYTGKAYSWYRGRDQVRLMIVIEPEKIANMGR